MIDGETARFIRSEIMKQMDIIVWGMSQGNKDETTEDIGNLFGSQSTMTERQLVEPYGLHSRAPIDTIQCVGKNGEHPGSRVVLGHWDGNRPALSQGCVVLYNQFGQQIYLNNGKILIGSAAAAQNFVLGKIFQSMMSTVLGAIAAHTHEGNLGFPTGVPLNASVFSGQQSSPVNDGTILSNTIMGVP